MNNPNFQASLDRIDSSAGYIVGNVQFVSKTINFAKADLTDDLFKEFLDLVRKS